jgi:glycosyltransferase involved in cell wall biosynthesis
MARIELVPGSERDRVLSLASVVVIPSRVVGGRSEGTPLIAIEALAAGVPVVASSVGGLRELDRDQRAVHLVPPDDPRRLAAAIDAALAVNSDPLEVRATVADRDWTAIASRLMPDW